MGKTVRTATRPSNKRKLTWIVIDMQKFLQLTTAHGRSLVHEGSALRRLLSSVRVMVIRGQYSESQARLLASNGGRWDSYELRLKSGSTRGPYMDAGRFAVIEESLLEYFYGQPRIVWDTFAARCALYLAHGAKILLKLSSEFYPERDLQLDLPHLSQASR